MQAIIDLLAIYLIKNFSLEDTAVSNASELPHAGRKVYIYCFIDRNKKIIKVYIFFLYLLGTCTFSVTSWFWVSVLLCKAKNI